MVQKMLAGPSSNSFAQEGGATSKTLGSGRAYVAGRAKRKRGTELGDLLRPSGLRQWEQSALESLRCARKPKASSAEMKRIKERASTESKKDDESST